jgi:hypothetical protein
MISIDKKTLLNKFLKIQTKIENFDEYLKSVSTDENLERYASVMAVLNKRMFIIAKQYERLNNLIKQ